MQQKWNLQMIKASFCGVLHKNEKDEWGYWCERYRNCTAVYWQPASENQIYYLESYRKNRLKEYIKEQQKLYFRNLWDNPYF